MSGPIVREYGLPIFQSRRSVLAFARVGLCRHWLAQTLGGS
jgi:hypothetical protein